MTSYYNNCKKQVYLAANNKVLEIIKYKNGFNLNLYDVIYYQ